MQLGKRRIFYSIFDEPKLFLIGVKTEISFKQSHQFLPLLFLFLYLLVSRFAKHCRICQLLALCLKCRRPETWTGFQTFFEFQHSNSYNKERPNSNSYNKERLEFCVRMSNLFRMSTFEFKRKRMTEHRSMNDVLE